ncbi:ABC transporter permease, partial [Candidatus Shapirobacteria bacterium]|nr:ABC transporter permease [Candidatus Shapirobacteria bacterium]
IKKIYFPRILLSIGATVTPVVDFGFAFLVYFLLMAVFGYTPSIMGLLAVPFLLLISIISASGLGLFLASVNVKYRDVRYILPFFIQILMFVTPVIYPVTLIPERFKLLAYLNPMTGVISTARTMILGVGIVDGVGLLVSIMSAIVLLVFGLVYFRKTERFFADII